MGKLMLRCCFCFVVLLGVSSFMPPQTTPQLIDKVLGKLLLYTRGERPEKTYLHTDRDVYINGDTIWFKAYLLDGIYHSPSPKSKVVHVELLNGTGDVLQRKMVYNGSSGAVGEMKIGHELPEGDYALRAYTRYMLNEQEPVPFHKSIRVVHQPADAAFLEMEKASSNGNGATTWSRDKAGNKPLLRFFPEGGHLVEGLMTKMGVEIQDSFGNGLQVKGQIQDQDGAVVATFKSGAFGLGMVPFKPLPGSRYEAKIDMDGRPHKYEIPEIRQSGHVLNVLDRDKHIEVRVATNKDGGLENTVLVGHTRGKVFLKGLRGRPKGNGYVIKLDPAELVEGVAHFTLFSKNGEPLCERLFFVENRAKKTILNLRTDKMEYGPRERVSLKMDLEDMGGNVLEGDLSVSVVSNGGLQPGFENDMYSWLLLNSDVGGTVPNAGYFFDSAIKDRRLLLDALMLTHGWRRFEWKELMNKKTSRDMAFPPEKGIMINGRVRDMQNASFVANAQVSVSLIGEDVLQLNDRSNADGAFSLGPFFFQDSIDVIVQAKAPLQGKASGVDTGIDIHSARIPGLPLPKSKLVGRTTQKAPDSLFVAAARLKRELDVKFNQDGVIQLDEAVVKEAKRESALEEMLRMATGAFPTNGVRSERIFTDSVNGGEAMSVLDLLAMVPGVRVFYGEGFGEGQVALPGQSTFGSGQPLVLLDGIPIGIEGIQAMGANDIMFIDVVSGSGTSLWGTRGLFGVIALYTYRGKDKSEELGRYPGVANIKIAGLHAPEEFYTPNYAMVTDKHNRPDYRTTLHWNPKLMVEKGGQLEEFFYTGDLPGYYTVVVKGLSKDGRIIGQTHTFKVSDFN
ncbi:TonB-dependent receptor plug domain-containing protein [Maribacter sp. 2307ULW6-5]|uniref:TonB-dependent receptor n=1 Tax=Maribacter sp. 2307ULW6-5 TaxID=3386275 RepID=UPI0039BD0F50